ncbi:MAG: DUF2905 domain-containing protein [Deltaproteobacteria bacterium]|nr:DUF2905 domain-containing protein [Deltaproteobacteria bacterium]
MGSLGKAIIIIGIILVVIGLVLLSAHKIPFPGRLPGDIVIEKKAFGFYFPVITCLIISLVISLILYLFNRK